MNSSKVILPLSSIRSLSSETIDGSVNILKKIPSIFSCVNHLLTGSPEQAKAPCKELVCLL
jgi:hypothetical protein